jgi:hypothetical protein
MWDRLAKLKGSPAVAAPSATPLSNARIDFEPLSEEQQIQVFSLICFFR